MRNNFSHKPSQLVEYILLNACSVNSIGLYERLIPNIQSLANTFNYYLSIVSLFPAYTISQSLLSSYVTLYKRSRISDCFSTGFFLEKLGEKDLSRTIQEKGLRNIYPKILTLSQRIDLLYLLNQANDIRYETQIQLMEKDLFDWDNFHWTTGFYKNNAEEESVLKQTYIAAGYRKIHRPNGCRRHYAHRPVENSTCYYGGRTCNYDLRNVDDSFWREYTQRQDICCRKWTDRVSCFGVAQTLFYVSSHNDDQAGFLN